MNCRLLYVVGELCRGGSEHQLYLLLKSMDRRQYCPHVVVWNFSENHHFTAVIRELGVPIHGFSKSLSVFAKIRRLRRLVLDLSPEVLHSYSFYLNVATSFAAHGTKTIAIGSVRSNYLTDRIEAGPILGKLSARWPGILICNSFTAMQFANKSRGFFNPRRLLVVPNGLDLNTMICAPIPSGTKARLLAIGSLIPVKRWDRLLEAVAELKKKALAFSVRIVGGGALRGALEQQTRTLGLESYVEFLGHRDDLPMLLSDSTLLVHTSDAEGCPNVVMEAMASGRPAVAIDAGDVPHLIEDGKTGFVARCGDFKTLVDCLATLIADPSLCQRMGEAGRLKAMRDFSLERMVGDTLLAYEATGWKR